MEEASVAGESPDRSKQRESSAETTSGSAGPVPEARGEQADTSSAPASAPRDPRVAMARTSGGSAGATGATDSPARGGVDTATRVLSLRDAEAPEDAEPKGAEPEDGEPQDAEPKDARPTTPEPLDGAEAEAEAEAASGTDADSDTDGREAGARGPERAQEAHRDAEAPEGAQEGVQAASAAHSDAESAPAAAADDADDANDADDEAGPPAKAEAEAAEGDADTAEDAGAPKDERLRAVVAAWVHSADDAGTGAGAPSGGAADDEPADAEPTDSEPADAQGAVSGSASTAASEADVAEPTDAKPVADKPVGGSADDDEAEGDADGEAGSSDVSPADAPSAGGGAAKAPAGKPVDNPTTAFKAVRPDKPRVDQPTTMLKMPGTTKAGGTDATAAPEESPAERTSKFVALKPLDDPSTRGSRPVPAEAAPSAPRPGADRTTQQPLPPKPPLDLLAELTNTPPPPDTAVRTTLRRIKIWTPLVLLLIVVFAVAQAVRPLPTPGLTLTADDSYTFDGKSAALSWPSEGQGWMDVEGVGTMGDVGKQTPVAIGSVAKAMTAYIVLKDHPLQVGKEGASIPVDATAEKEGGYDKDGESTLNTVKAGDKLTEKQALSAIMIPSANNIARLLARWDAGSEAAFVKKMNATAKKLGMTNTTYTDPSGLKESTLSTSRDQVKLGNELVKIPALMAITKLPSWTDPSGKVWGNYNHLVPYDGALGIKTGTTTAAGGNLLFAATKEVGGETVTVVGAILGQHTAPIIDTVNAVSKTAMTSAQSALKSATILKKGQVVGYVDDKLGGKTPVVVTKDVAAVGWAGLKVKLSFEADDVPHTAKAGTKVGTLTVGDGTDGAVKVPVALQNDLTEPGFSAKLTRIL
ncbi:D-alanyl-D-alanine carboxypeptidase [Streptomyces sp. NPDC008150]|uniref:D-alanyl-D-alanine carboxypeptidase n=1 Tax=Streptomyces sp. NPDC008150 TaxID=3364816 RepID=UPI0036E0AE5D